MSFIENIVRCCIFGKMEIYKTEDHEINKKCGT
jgi:hypothetical protein